MSTPSPTWQEKARGTAATALFVAIALYLVVSLLDQIAPMLFALAGLAVLSSVLVAIIRYRRSRW